VRFYRDAVADAGRAENLGLTLGEYVIREGYSVAFLRDHLLPMGSSIWSASLKDMRAYPLAAFVRFFKNHGLLETSNRRRPQWRTVTGGSREYVRQLTEGFADRIRLNSPVVALRRMPNRVDVTVAGGHTETFDQVVIASHSDQALAMLSDASPTERRLLSAMRYERNSAMLHTDESFMPRRRSAWASWNYSSTEDATESRLVCLTYWMNMLQNIDRRFPLFVTLNPHRPPKPESVIASFEFDHPVFDMAALDAQQELWALQGVNRTWFCGAYFGHGFHEDGLQAGLAVGEALGGLRRPWQVENESGRIHLHAPVEAAA
jgi:predicted NAD/FAD-binding protein